MNKLRSIRKKEPTYVYDFQYPYVYDESIQYFQPFELAADPSKNAHFINVNEESEVPSDRVKERLKKKALNARTRYHSMTPEERKATNRRRCEAIKQKRLMVERLLETPASQCTPEMLEIIQKHMAWNQRRCETAKRRYANMTPDQRKAYNSKRYVKKGRVQKKEKSEDA